MFKAFFETIIVGVDFSDYSKLVVKQARSLCKLWNAKLILAYAIPDQVNYTAEIYFSFPNIIDENSYASRIQKIYKLTESAQAVAVAEHGAPSVLLTKLAEKNPNSLIMVGYKGHSPLANFFFGNTAQSLALKCSVPVWIHRGTKVIQPNRILIPHDLSAKANRAIDIVEKLSLVNPMTYEVFFVKERPFPVLDYKTYRQMEQKLLRQQKSKTEHLLQAYPRINFNSVDGETTSQIAQRTHDFDLVVMTHHTPTGLFTKSETVELLKKVKTPVLVMH